MKNTHTRLYPIFTEGLVLDSDILTGLVYMKEKPLAITKMAVSRAAVKKLWDDMDAPQVLGKDGNVIYAYSSEKDEYDVKYVYAVIVQFEAEW